MKKILFVDDDKSILKSLDRLFMDTDYEIEKAEGGKEALELLAVNNFDLVVSDMRMPVMDGYEFLSKVKQLYPNIMRIMLSGYSEEEVVFEALKKNIAKLYIFKPWKNEELLKIVEHIFQTEDTLKGNNLLMLINNIDHLPTIKQSFNRIINLIEKDADVLNISREIESDQAVAMKILQVANSAFYGTKTGSVQQAVSFIGLKNTRNLVLSTSIIDSLDDCGIIGDSIERIWQHAFISNRLLSHIYEKHLKRKIKK